MTEAVWTTSCKLRIFNQIEGRPGQPEADGTAWLEHRRTGLVAVICNCGYSTGWVDRDSLPTIGELSADHGNSLHD